MKKILLALFTLTLSLASFAQSKNLTAQLKNEKATFSQTENGSVTVFDLNTNEGQIKELKAQASSIVEKMELSVVKNGEGKYTCRLNIYHQNHAEYVHKMFVYLGIDGFTLDGKKKNLDELPAVLKALK
jgi:hypothetical protein